MFSLRSKVNDFGLEELLLGVFASSSQKQFVQYVKLTSTLSAILHVLPGVVKCIPHYELLCIMLE